MADILPFGQPKDYPEAPRFVRPLEPTTIQRIYAEQGRPFADERAAIAADNAEASGWAMLAAAVVAGIVLGMLAVLIPATIIAAVVS